MNFKGIPSLQNYGTIKESEAFTKNQIPYKMNRVYRVLKRNVRNVRFLRHIPVSQGWPPQDQLAQQGRAPFPTLQPPYSTMRRRDYSYFLELVINTALQFIRCNNCYFKPISVLGGTSLGKHFLFICKHSTLYYRSSIVILHIMRFPAFNICKTSCMIRSPTCRKRRKKLAHNKLHVLS